jgi:hypothetical protein
MVAGASKKGPVVGGVGITGTPRMFLPSYLILIKKYFCVIVYT